MEWQRDGEGKWEAQKKGEGSGDQREGGGPQGWDTQAQAGAPGIPERVKKQEVVLGSWDSDFRGVQLKLQAPRRGSPWAC